MKREKIQKKRILPLKLAKKLFFALTIMVFFDFFLFPLPVLANESKNVPIPENFITEINTNNTNSTPEKLDSGKISSTNNLPKNNNWKAVRATTRVITAYNSDINQCDSTPCITANGFNVCEHGIEDTIAANWLKFGTKVRIPELFGDRVFVVRDRMNKKHDDKVDVWMIDKQAAKKFGRKIAKIEVLE